MKTRSLFFAVILLAAGRLDAAEIDVLAAASLTDVLKEIGGHYEKETADKVHFNFGASNLLERQIEEGAPADLFFSADEAKMDQLEKKGLLQSGSRHNVLSNSLVIIVPSDSKATLGGAAELSGPNWKKIAIAQPDSVPAGIYTRQYLQSIGQWDSLQDKIIPTENVRAALAAVETGNVEAGFVYKTDALISKKVRIALEVPPREGPAIVYPLAVVKSSKNLDAAGRFATYLTGPKARPIFEKFGFGFASNGSQ